MRLKIKQSLAASIIILLSSSSVLSYSKADLAELIKENESNNKLIEYKDNESNLKLKMQVLDEINRNRAKHGLRPVKLDILASRVANRTASEAAKNNYFSHWNLRGEKPYHRYAFAGGMHHVSENGSTLQSSNDLLGGEENILNYIISLHRSLYNETPPNDGHRKNILNPWHTDVGLGYALIGSEFRYYEEFIDKYLNFDDIAAEIKAGDVSKISGAISVPGYAIYAVVVNYEPFTSPLTPSELNATGAYPDFSKITHTVLPYWSLSYDNASRKFAFSFKTSKSGLYYVKIYIKKGLSEKGGSRSISTDGLTPVSGIVIKAK